MSGQAWMNGPVGLGAQSRVLRRGCRTVLVVVPFLVAGIRLLDVLALLEGDHRVTVVFTVAPAPNGAVCHGPEEFIRERGGLPLPWQQAVQCQFDLILAASETAVEQLHGPVLLVPHGAGALPSRLRARSAGPQAQPAHPLDRGALVHRGRLVPAGLALTHRHELEVLRESCPEAVPVAVVAGDLCYDRLVAGLPRREAYRRALGVRTGQRLVVVTSTWQPESALGAHPDLLERLLAELPRDRYRIAAVLHPNIWGVQGAWTVRAWLAHCLRAGLLLMPPEEGWRAALVAANAVVGDYGSVTGYAAAIGAPVAVVPQVEGYLRPGSLADAVGRGAYRLRMDRPLGRQLRETMLCRSPEFQQQIAELITSEPGRAAVLLRRTVYGLLELPEPPRPPRTAPVPLPVPVELRREEAA